MIYVSCCVSSYTLVVGVEVVARARTGYCVSGGSFNRGGGTSDTVDTVIIGFPVADRLINNCLCQVVSLPGVSETVPFKSCNTRQ